MTKTFCDRCGVCLDGRPIYPVSFKTSVISRDQTAELKIDSNVILCNECFVQVFGEKKVARWQREAETGGRKSRASSSELVPYDVALLDERRSRRRRKRRGKH